MQRVRLVTLETIVPLGDGLTVSLPSLASSLTCSAGRCYTTARATIPAFEQFVDGTADPVTARQPPALVAKSLMQFGDQRRRHRPPGCLRAPQQRGH
jgi:hypothetical protein